MKQTPLITLTTDFGTADGYVGTMKGVILGIAPNARLVDLSHAIAPQNVREAAFVLFASYSFFPAHSVHLVIVDPGVGGARRAIALRTPAGTFVGPDNGVFGYVMAREPVEALVEIVDPRYRLSRVSHTFHGRDVFAPATAHLAAGVPIAGLGPPISDPVTLPLPRLEVAAAGIVGQVLHVDHFGNVVTSIGELTRAGDGLMFEPAFGKARGTGQDAGCRVVAASARVEVAGQEIMGVRRAYTQVEPGAVLALVGSSGYLEIAVREGSAALILGVCPGDEVVLRF
ncbi:MAG: SAM-dependent chlorinase/fluorinase [Anaerolineae bacterium]|nr:SAM-dependent chlorinase/fluorinase [Anaerolineae bacterium]